ncbi:MAG: Fpg/Nei family DNA glycosylase [Acidimicrobiales bacterium]
MPELPEVEALVRYLGTQAVGRTIDAVRVGTISALKTFDPPVAALEGLAVTGSSRRGKFVIIDVAPLAVVLHLARGGWLRWHDLLKAAPVRPGRGPLALRVRFSDGAGFDVTEQGTEKRLAVWVVRDPAAIEAVARLGPDPLDPAFDAAALAGALAAHGGQVKGALTDQSRVAGVGNAYSDEALHVARLSPFKAAAKLTPGEVGRLHAALVSILSDAVERSAGLPAAGLKAEKRSGLRVHGRTGQPCPACGDTVREVAFATRSLQYCPTCQTGGKPLADRRLSRLLK